MISVGTEQLSIPVIEELEPYMDKFDKSVLRDDKLQSCSPFRYDSHPSFAVHLENGSWIDSGAVEGYRKGHFIQLLSFLRQETAEDTVQYLLNKYSITKVDVDALSVDMSWLHPKPKPKIFFSEDLQQYAFRSPYLASRGISEEVQREFRIGFDRSKNAIVMPWCNSKSEVVNLKFRAVDTKRFWYHKEGQRVKDYIYGMDKVYKSGFEEVWLVESEIDCLRLWTLGIVAVAFGTANMSPQQESMIRNSSISKLIIAVDNDDVGKGFKQKLINKFSGQFEMNSIIFPSDSVKDIGDMSDDVIKYCAANLQQEGIKLNLTL